MGMKPEGLVVFAWNRSIPELLGEMDFATIHSNGGVPEV